MVSQTATGSVGPLRVAIHGDSEAWAEVEPLLCRHCLPFGEFYWEPTREGLDPISVQGLELSFHLNEDVVLDDFAPALEWSRRAFLHILIVRCDDVKAYKESDFDQTRAWVIHHLHAMDAFTHPGAPPGSSAA